MAAASFQGSNGNLKKATVGRWCKRKHSARYVPRMHVQRKEEIKAISKL